MQLFKRHIACHSEEIGQSLAIFISSIMIETREKEISIKRKRFFFPMKFLNDKNQKARD